MHAFAIARGHSAGIYVAAGGRRPAGAAAGPASRFPAMVSDTATGTIFPQFYHLWPALLATSYDVGGDGALVATTPLLGALAVMLTVAVVPVCPTLPTRRSVIFRETALAVPGRGHRDVEALGEGADLVGRVGAWTSRRHR